MSEFLNTPNIDLYLVVGILFVFGLIEFLLGHYKNSGRKSDDWILEGIGFLVVAFTKSLIVAAVFFLGKAVLPASFEVLSAWSLLPAFVFYLLIDDVLQYWYHRSAHEYNWLWKHHRVHHAAKEMGILTSYRNSWVYYLLMPNLWWGGIATFLGLGPSVLLGLIVKQVVVTSTHSTWRWDDVLYRSRILKPIAWVVEHIFITPAFHHAHHGRDQSDHVSDPNGNFGNTFSMWDQLFGTAKFTRKFPAAYGLQTDPGDKWTAHLLYPFVKSGKEGSEIGKGHQKKKNTGVEPLQTTLEKGTYLYCQCGYSSTQPWCNGSHHGSKFKPMVVEIEKERKASICTCKLTKSPPYCDDSHLSLTEQPA